MQDWREVESSGVGVVGSPLPKAVWNELYGRLEVFSDFVATRPEYTTLFNTIAKKWQLQSGLRMQYSGYFSPYFRNRVQGEGAVADYSAGKVMKDVNKIVAQFCEPYFRFLATDHPDLLAIPEFRDLVEAMSCALFTSYGYYREMIADVASVDAPLAKALTSSTSVPPVSLRLIRYAPDERFFANPHVDKSAVTIIMDTDESSRNPRLVFAPAGDALPRLSAFRPVHRSSNEALVFFGAAPREAGFGVRPAVHAVRPQQVSRHVAIFFWLLPGIDMASFNTNVPFVDDLGESRPSLGTARPSRAASSNN